MLSLLCTIIYSYVNFTYYHPIGDFSRYCKYDCVTVIERLMSDIGETVTPQIIFSVLIMHHSIILIFFID